MSIEIYGAVIVRGVTYEDGRIAELLDANIDDWKFTGDQPEDEANIVVGDECYRTLDEALVAVGEALYVACPGCGRKHAAGECRK